MGNNNQKIEIEEHKRKVKELEADNQMIKKNYDNLSNVSNELNNKIRELSEANFLKRNAMNELERIKQLSKINPSSMIDFKNAYLVIRNFKAAAPSVAECLKQLDNLCQYFNLNRVFFTDTKMTISPDDPRLARQFKPQEEIRNYYVVITSKEEPVLCIFFKLIDINIENQIKYANTDNPNSFVFFAILSELTPYGVISRNGMKQFVI